MTPKAKWNGENWREVFSCWVSINRIVTVSCYGHQPGNQIWVSNISRSIFTTEKHENAAFFFVDHLFFSFLLGLFDWKKDRKFFARFEEPVSPERDSPTDDGELLCLL